MDYTKHYNALVEKAQNKRQDGYTEKHHIVPKCLGGTDDKENLVCLNPEEHYVAHQLLVKMYPDNQKLVYALNKMTQGRPSNKRYGWVKRRWQEVCKKRTGEKNGSYGKSWYHNPETGEAGKFLTAPRGWVKGRKLKHLPTCKQCGAKTSSFKSKYCSEHGKAAKIKEKYTEEDIIKAYELFGNNISKIAKEIGVKNTQSSMRVRNKIKKILDKISPDPASDS